ncbi:4Fe-4S binding protein [Candidatus Zixiibacteriota bacterium]
MNKSKPAFHFVCTREQARELVGGQERFWASNCGCREDRERGCKRSRMDLCLMFRDDIVGSGGSGKREVFIEDVQEFFREAEENHLVIRPYRDEETRTRVDGICFCCDDCCEYFVNPNEVCDKGDLIEKTDLEACTHCGMCVDVCYFGARQIVGEELAVDREKCYGCGLCLDVCPVECVEMVSREQ